MKIRGNRQDVYILPNKGGQRNFAVSLMAGLVVLVQIFLPLAPLFAYEEEGVPTAPENADVSEQSVTVREEDTPVEAALTESEPEPIIESETPAELETVGDASVEPDSASVPAMEEEILPEVTPPISETIPQSIEPDGTQDASSTTSPEAVVEEPTDTAVIEDAPVEVEDEEVEDEPVLEEEASPTTTTPVTVLEPEVHTVINDENRFSFGVDDCAQVADGSFYCKKAEEKPEVILEDRVFAGPDKDGDNEIFIERAGELIQITSNTDEDDAPYYDAESNTIVWHRLINGRYQIVSYDIEESEETVLTHDHYNNMQPSRTGDITVWQGWVGNDWEILLMEGGEISMITDNTVHDIGPRINGDYVIWQAEESDGWKVRVYNRLTKETETISDTEGASIENPRLVLLYDAKDQNGDIETRGYDLVSGETVPISASHGPTPEDIPDPDQTGEDRALINTSSQLKTKTEEDGDTPPDPEDASSTPPIVDDGGDLIIPPTTPPAGDIVLGDIPTTTAEDLVIPSLPLIEEVPPIEDLVIAPFVESNTEVLPQ